MKFISVFVLTLLFALISESTSKASSEFRCKSLCNNVGGISRYLFKNNEWICQCYTEKKITGKQFIKLQEKSAYWSLPIVITPVGKNISKRQIEDLPYHLEQQPQHFQQTPHLQQTEHLQQNVEQTPPELNTRHLEHNPSPMNSFQEEQKFPRLKQKIDDLLQAIPSPEPILGQINPSLIDHSNYQNGPVLKPLQNLLPNLHQKIPGSKIRLTDPILVQPVHDPFTDTLRKHINHAHPLLPGFNSNSLSNSEHQVNQINVNVRMDQTTRWFGNAFNWWRRGLALGATGPMEFNDDVTPDPGSEKSLTESIEKNFATTMRAVTEEYRTSIEESFKAPQGIIVQPKEFMDEDESNPTE